MVEKPEVISDSVISSSPITGTQDHSAVKYDALSLTQKHRYDYLLPLFGDETATLIPLIEGRGRNSWSKVNEKINLLDQAKFNEQGYHDALYDNFIVGETYTSSSIIGVVGDVRRDLGLKPYISRLRINCESDFFNLFITHEVTEDETIDGKIKKKVVGYQPVFKLKSDE